MSDGWNLFLDDLRSPLYVDQDGVRVWVVARDLREAKRLCERQGMPSFISFDHDLGPDEDSMMFLKWLAYEFFDEARHRVPGYQVHSANPVGSENIVSFMESWKRSLTLP